MARRRIIDELRRRWPGAWSYKPDARMWVGPGVLAWWCAALAPQYDGDDDTFRRELWAYPDGAPAVQLRGPLAGLRVG